MMASIASCYELPEIFTCETVATFLGEPGSLPSIWGIWGKDVTRYDFDVLPFATFARLPFNQVTQFSPSMKEKAHRLLNYAKRPGLGIEKLHRHSIDGRGVTIAVVDKPILETHYEFARCMQQYNLIIPEHEHNNKMHFHGAACAAFLCGATTGVANGAKLHYYAYPDWFEEDGMYWGYHFQAFEQILTHNRNAADKIRIVSVSAGFPRSRTDLQEKMDSYLAQLATTGCTLIYSNRFGEHFTCATQTQPFDSDNADTYDLDTWQTNEWDRRKVVVPSGCRTSPCNSEENAYVYNGGSSCYSWAIPYLCGVYALALQVKPELCYDDFCQLANQTAVLNKAGLAVLSPQGIIRAVTS